MQITFNRDSQVKNSIVFLFALCALPVNAAIYTWSDEQGITQYGDCPPEKCGSKAVDMEPLVILQSDPLPELPEWKSKATLEKEKVDKVMSDKSFAETIPSFGLNPPLKQYQCHQSPESMQDPNWALMREAVEAKPLEKREAAEVGHFFHKIKGVWRGDMNQIVFIRRDGEPKMLERDYRARMSVDKSSIGQIQFQMDLDPRKNYSGRSVLRDLQYWITLDKAGILRSGSHKNFNEDSKFKNTWSNQFVGWNDGKLEIIKNSTGRRGGVSKLSYRFFERKNNHVLMTECYYTQGYIESIRTWKLRNS